MEKSRGIGRRELLGGVAAGAVAVAAGALPARAAEAATVSATASAQGHGGAVTVTLEVSVADEKIVACQIEGPDETEGIGSTAIDEMSAAMEELGTYEVDMVSGATETSTAIKTAARSAYNAALGRSAAESVMKPGTYTASASSHWYGYETPVSVTVGEHEIRSITVERNPYKNADTEIILDSAVERYIPRIIANQSLAIDAVAGATETCAAIKNAAYQAISEALVAGCGSDEGIEAFMQAPAKPHEGETEELTCDLVVCGLGGGGPIALLRAVQRMQELNGGRRVSVIGIEKSGRLGGKSGLTHEGFAINPPKMCELFNGGEPYCDESIRDWWLDFYIKNDEGEYDAKPDVAAAWLDATGPSVDWMYDNGVRWGGVESYAFSDEVDYGGTQWSPVCLTGPTEGYFDARRPIMADVYKSMVAQAQAQGAMVLMETEGRELMAEGGAITGIKAHNSATGRDYVIHTKAVIMNTGGFGANLDLVREWIGEDYAAKRAVGTCQDTGEMIEAAIAVGAGTYNLDIAPMNIKTCLDFRTNEFPTVIDEEPTNTLNAQSGKPRAWSLDDVPWGMAVDRISVFVNDEGERYCADEYFMDTWNRKALAGGYFHSVCSQSQVDVWRQRGFHNILFWDNDGLHQGWFPTDTAIPDIQDAIDVAVEAGLLVRADTLEELGEAIGVDGKNLAAAIERYNGFCDAGVDDDFGKSADYLVRFSEDGPYYAAKVNNSFFCTLGGLDVDENMNVLTSDGVTPLGGLYAIGADSEGCITSRQRGYVGCGPAQSWIRAGGYLAGYNAAQYVSDAYGLTSPAVCACPYVGDTADRLFSDDVPVNMGYYIVGNEDYAE